jgi:hypothetical protein
MKFSQKLKLLTWVLVNILLNQELQNKTHLRAAENFHLDLKEHAIKE